MTEDKKWYIYVFPAQRLVSVPLVTYRKLCVMKIWGNPDDEVQLGTKNRPLKIKEFDPFPDPRTLPNYVAED